MQAGTCGRLSWAALLHAHSMRMNLFGMHTMMAKLVWMTMQPYHLEAGQNLMSNNIKALQRFVGLVLTLASIDVRIYKVVFKKI